MVKKLNLRNRLRNIRISAVFFSLKAILRKKLILIPRIKQPNTILYGCIH